MIYIPLPTERTPTKLADWLEINALLDLDGESSYEDLRSILSSEEETRDDQVEEGSSEALSTDTFNEISKRLEAGKSGYPFKLLAGGLIKKKTNNSSTYIFCLLISFFGNQKQDYFVDWTTPKVSKKFESISAKSIENLLKNDHCKLSVKIFGWPRKYDGDITNPRFTDALKQLCEDCGEMEANERPIASIAKDGGLDIIAWKKFPDSLRGSIFFWGQCATGRDWESKLKSVEDFEEFVIQPTKTITGTFIPHTFDLSTEIREDTWKSLSHKAGIIFDRSRISYLLRYWNEDGVINFCAQALKGIKDEYRRNLGQA